MTTQKLKQESSKIKRNPAIVQEQRGTNYGKKTIEQKPSIVLENKGDSNKPYHVWEPIPNIYWNILQKDYWQYMSDILPETQ